MRYLKVLYVFWRASVEAEMEYRLNFVVSILSSVGHTVGGLFILSLFYRDGRGFGGWDWNDALVILGIFTLIEGLSQSLLNPNLNRIVEHVQDGTLDFVLLKPIDSQFWLSLRYLSLWGIPSMLAGISLIAYGLSRRSIQPADVLLGAVVLLAGLLILYSLWFMLGTLSIWFVKIYNITYVLKALVEGGRFPLTAYPPLYRLIMTYVVPVAFLTTVPAETFLGRGSTFYSLLGVGLAFLFLMLSRAFWRFALRYYTSASS
ncbi:MAG: ABC transporter permease [Thermotogae bacterium]|nr:ABC transporter permease [Thermotogota bacterium]